MGPIFKERRRLTTALMKQWNFGSLYGLRTRKPAAVAALALMITVAGCSVLRGKPALPPASAVPADQTSDVTPPPGPEAKIQISYSQPNDYLDTLSLTKYSAATTLTSTTIGAGGASSVVRFEGGIPVWQIDIEPGMFSDMPIGVSSKNYAVSEVKYGKVPPHFVQTIPDLGPPEPLEADHFYIFSVTRKSGSISYDAVKVNSDGSLQAYEADPRAGTSFRLCCNLPSDFSVTPPPSDVDSAPPSEAPPPDDTAPDASSP
jgi:hypothetical protein